MNRQALLGLTHFKNKNGIIVVEAPTVHKANQIFSEILQKYSDSKTALFLSGGKTPKKLYEEIAMERNLKAGAVLVVDERFGEKMHKKSNELMIRNTGLVKYFEDQNIRFYPILQDELGLADTSSQYDESLRFIFKYFPKSVGVLGLGIDGHTAGLPSGNQKSKIKTSTFAKASADKQNLSGVTRRILEDQSSLVTFYEDEKYGARITMTFLALLQLDLIILLVLGQEKREALKMMFADSSQSSGQAAIEEIPASSY
ncbi:MAG: 6-phosphogluconolactonase, partial [Candidatus Levybacteria bacterium]|nr:6-phosphogluconolactonase [Candidatus Levybacteria bacterium]